MQEIHYRNKTSIIEYDKEESKFALWLPKRLRQMLQKFYGAFDNGKEIVEKKK